MFLCHCDFYLKFLHKFRKKYIYVPVHLTDVELWQPIKHYSCNHIHFCPLKNFQANQISTPPRIVLACLLYIRPCFLAVDIRCSCNSVSGTGCLNMQSLFVLSIYNLVPRSSKLVRQNESPFSSLSPVMNLVPKLLHIW